MPLDSPSSAGMTVCWGGLWQIDQEWRELIYSEGDTSNRHTRVTRGTPVLAIPTSNPDIAKDMRGCLRQWPFNQGNVVR